jgi:hypothetical protein
MTALYFLLVLVVQNGEIQPFIQLLSGPESCEMAAQMVVEKLPQALVACVALDLPVPGTDI